MDVFVILLLSGFCFPTASIPYIYSFVNKNMTWGEARTYCIKEHAALAQIIQPDNITALRNTPTGGYTGKAWIGLYGALRWTWLDGLPDTYFNGSDAPLYSDYCALIYYVKNRIRRYYTKCTARIPSVCFNGSHYIVDKQFRTWNDAKANCESQQSVLVQIKNAETEAAVLKLLSAFREDVWIGLRTSLVWFWSQTNQINTVMNWETGQPDNQTGALCPAVVVENGSWTDEPCDAQYPFFCYDLYKSKKTVVRMNIQTDANLENPDNSAALMQQLQAALTAQGVTDFKLTWTKQPVKKSKKTTEDPCSP